jgi:hypothetical protein
MHSGRNYARRAFIQQRMTAHVWHANRKSSPTLWDINFSTVKFLKMPALRVGDQKVAKYLDARDRLEFFRVDEIGVERERVGFAE